MNIPWIQHQKKQEEEKKKTSQEEAKRMKREPSVRDKFKKERGDLGNFSVKGELRQT
jgi:hypothetical protein